MLQNPVSRWLEAGFQHPVQGLIALAAAQIGFWTLAPLLSHTAPPLDVVEMYAWGREGVVATFKHPNLPGLTLEGVRRLTGWAPGAAFLVSQLFIAATFAAVFLLGRELMDARRALAGTLLLTGVYFFSWPSPEFNHNVAQTPLIAGVAWLLWRATTRGGLWAWALLGALAGLSLWAKYSSAAILVFAPAWLLWDAQARRTLLTFGPWLALAAAVAVATPQALWLAAHDFQPFAYAARRAAGDQGGALGALIFLVTQALHHLPMLIVLMAAGWFGKPATDAPPQPERRALRYLLLMGLGPALLVAAGALIAGAELKAAWGAAMFSLSGLLAVALLSNRADGARLRRIGWGAGVLILLLSGLYFAHMRYGADLTGKPLKGNWPQAEISAALEEAWGAEANGAPLRIVAGDIWTAGLVGLNNSTPPSVFISNEGIFADIPDWRAWAADPANRAAFAARAYATSPWIDAQEIAQNGALIVWNAADARPPYLLDLLAPSAEPRVIEIGFPGRDNLAPLRFAYVALPPGAY